MLGHARLPSGHCHSVAWLPVAFPGDQVRNVSSQHDLVCPVFSTLLWDIACTRSRCTPGVPPSDTWPCGTDAWSGMLTHTLQNSQVLEQQQSEESSSGLSPSRVPGAKGGGRQLCRGVCDSHTRPRAKVRRTGVCVCEWPHRGKAPSGQPRPACWGQCHDPRGARPVVRQESPQTRGPWPVTGCWDAGDGCAPFVNSPEAVPSWSVRGQ